LPRPTPPHLRLRNDAVTGKRGRSVTAALWVGLCVAAPALQAQERGLGPLMSEDGAPLHRLGLTAAAERADPVTKGTVDWGVWLGWSNIFEQDSTATHVLMVDMERLISTATVRVGLAHGLEVGGRVTFETTGGGRLDGLISRWHGFLGVGNGNREIVPEGAYQQRVERTTSGVVIDKPHRALGMEDVQLFVKARVVGAEASDVAISLGATTRIPTDRGGIVHELPDVGVSFLARRSGGSWHLHGMFGAQTIRAVSKVDPDLFRDRAYHGLLGIERSFGPAWSAAGQYQVSTPVLSNFGHRELDAPSANLTVGVLGRLGDAWRWNLSLQEDLPAGTPAADFTLALGLNRRW